MINQPTDEDLAVSTVAGGSSKQLVLSLITPLLISFSTSSAVYMCIFVAILANSLHATFYKQV
ncbi:hypothetical protein Hanom_Chr07g00657481 [Helianthus anomalus]